MKNKIAKLRKYIIKWLGYELENKILKLEKEIEELKELNKEMYKVVNECREDSRTIKSVSVEVGRWWFSERDMFLKQVQDYVNAKKDLKR